CATSSRAAAFRPGATASSRSATIASASDSSAFASFRSSSAGAKRTERTVERSVLVPQFYVRHSAPVNLTGAPKSDINASRTRQRIPGGRSVKAVRFHEFGGLDVLRLEEVPDPAPGRGQVLIDVTASALNHLDVDIREGTSRFPVELPFIPGVEVVGRIAALGEDVEGWQVGDRVMALLQEICGECEFCRTGRESLCTAAGFISFSTSGGYAERLACSARQLLRIPDALDDDAAAALQIAFGTAWHMLFTRGRLRNGRTGQI